MTARLDPPLYHAYHADLHLRAFFPEVPTEEGVAFDQDHAICRRWLRCGGEVWADPAARGAHVGDFAFGAPSSRYRAALGAGGREGANGAPP